MAKNVAKCSNCGRSTTIDDDPREVHALCMECDQAYYEWKERTCGVYVDTFLTTNAAKNIRRSRGERSARS